MVEIKTGKFGQYFHDTNTKEDLSLNEVKNRLNKAEEKLTKEEVFYKIGDKLKILMFGVYRTFMVCSCAFDSVVLIEAKGDQVGHRYTESVKVKNLFKITEEEMSKLSCGKSTNEITRIV